MEKTVNETNLENNIIKLKNDIKYKDIQNQRTINFYKKEVFTLKEENQKILSEKREYKPVQALNEPYNIDYFESLNRNFELKRLDNEKQKQAFRTTLEGKIEIAITYFKLWCYCLGYDPYRNTNKLMKEYLDTNNNQFKHDSRFLFIESETNKKETVQENKKLLLNKLNLKGVSL